ncbi:MAG: glycosyltransferase family 2 protein [Acaryochloridaceae cyanobacterium SU_2_1]|nr:glycosyltransferase family 2 protein [Acaryochloridaceae cyanobacterium SU_2_1]
MKLVSVIVPVFNVEDYIAEAIHSVLSQTYKNFELIIVDDESPDGSIDICRQINDPRIKIVHQKNRGLAGARNTGIRHAQGEYLAFLDSDDLWRSEKLEKHVAHLDSAANVGVSFSRSAFIDAEGQSVGIYQMPKLKDISAGHLLCRNPIGNGSAPVIRRQVFDQIGFCDNRHGSPEQCYFDEDLRQSEDIECWIRIIAQTPWDIEGIPDALTLYRVNTGGLSAQVLKQYQSWEQVVTKTRAYAPDLVAQWEKPARAYQLRYLARRAVRLQDAPMAVQLTNQAIATHWQIIFTEPSRTLLTLAAAYSMALLPKRLYSSIEQSALQTMGKLQRRQINRQSGNVNV